MGTNKTKPKAYEDNTISYSAGNLDISYAEGSCFATKEEAQKECDKRNGKENNRCK